MTFVEHDSGNAPPRLDGAFLICTGSSITESAARKDGTTPMANGFGTARGMRFLILIDAAQTFVRDAFILTILPILPILSCSFDPSLTTALASARLMNG